ncbi:TatD DNase family protein [Virgibacillus subterraneus]|uniref:TatD DNase family protein n=1 Tax=Virgibacillus subterraneus TaxID=621109 RepID=A0A1H9JYB1_9BACI|nr:TatD family hydrolase [Virgibacillus subterraneus]SEQ91797.1 TatD DNase family protein [Virgibacillus subterraneus]
MSDRIIDSHIHLDMYRQKEQLEILSELELAQVEALICVSNHLKSSKEALRLAHEDSRIKPAFGFHPEQALPTDYEAAELLTFIEQNQHEMIAIGEVGLPYYLRQDNKGVSSDGYVELLETFVQKAAALGKPIILHAIYEDAPIACDLLEKYSVPEAHFHWFKGDSQTIERMAKNSYSISVTPDVLYEKEIQDLVRAYPLSRMMVETDGPWPFEGIFKGSMTHPGMIHKSLEKIAELKKVSAAYVYSKIYENTCRFYKL